MTGSPLQQASPLKSRGAQAGSGAVRVICGVHTLEAQVAGRSVGEVRAALSQALNVSPAAVAVVDGVEVEAGHVLREGEQLEFVRLAGEKGRFWSLVYGLWFDRGSGGRRAITTWRRPDHQKPETINQKPW